MRREGRERLRAVNLDDVRELVRSLPEAEEILTWGTDVTFRVRGKIFAIGGEGSERLSVKATPETQADLIDMDPVTFARSAYVGRFGWVTVALDRVERAQLQALLTEAWRRTAPKRLAAAVADAEAVRR